VSAFRRGVAAATLVTVAAGLLSALPARAQDTARKTNDLLSSVAGIAQNLELADVPSPIDITADRMEFDYGKGLLRYDGNVTVDHAGARIKAKSLEVSFEPEGKRSLRKITARGGVEVTKGDESARGELAEYDPKAATVTLSQNARLGSGNNSLAGEKVVVYLDEKRAVVLGGGGGGAAASPPVAAAPGTPAPAPSGRIKAVLMPDAVEKKPDGKK
jgi:lipopolysaccharide export system protein LptA